ncbi:MAG: hypothetical protein AB9856_01950 [Cellulosilyticaceae bacterium]
MKSNYYFWGILLVIVGALGVLDNIFGINLIGHYSFWPLIILAIGLCFEFAYFSAKKAPGLLVPGGILTTIGLLFMFETLTNWHFSAYTWPVYPLAVAIGLFQLYWFGGREKGLLIPVGILTLVATVSFVTRVFGSMYSWLTSSSVISILMVIAGLAIIFRSIKKNQS